MARHDSVGIVNRIFQKQLHAWLVGLLLAIAGWSPVWAAETLVPPAEGPVRLAQDIPTQPRMMVPDVKALAIVVVPDLGGRTVAEARTLLEKSGLQLGKVGQVPAQQAVGTVVRQSPAAKQTATRNSAVDIWIAEAPAIRVPNLVGRPLKEAEALLRKSGFRLGQVASVTSKYPEGTVARQSPSANSTADRGTSINVWIAAAPVTPSNLVEVPDVVNRQLKEAEAILARSGLNLGPVTRLPSDAADGTVIRQSPAAGQGVNRDSRVNVWVAQAGPAPSADLVKVPDLRKRQVKEAAAILREAGLRLGNVTRRPSDVPPGTVLSQSPSAGQGVDRDSPVDVWVAEATEIKVPSVVGSPLKEAAAILAKAGLRMREAGREASGHPEGSVARQAPAPGEAAGKGSFVEVWVATAATVAVPELRGLAVEDAGLRLRESRLRAGAKSERPSLPPAGRVIDQKPLPGAEVKVGTPVAIVVGDGARAQVPEIVGRVEGAAVEMLEAAGLRPGARRTEESERPEGEVLRQRPAPESLVARGSAVAYTVAVPQTVAVPRIVGLMAGDAVAQLEPLGLAGQEAGAEESDRPEGEILRQEPAPGTRVPRGERVAFWVSVPALVAVPDLAGMRGPDIAERLRAEGLVAGEGQTEESRSPEGTVIRQEPPAGARVARGAPVNYWTAVPARVPVPGLVGTRADDARARLSELGLVMAAREPEENDAPEGTVIGHEPPAGTPVPLGTEIAVRISAGPPLSPWVIGGGIGAALLAAGGGLWLARRPPRPPSRKPAGPQAVKPELRVHMDKPDAAAPDGLTLDPKTPAVGVLTRLMPGDSAVSAEKELVVREERRES